MLKVDRYVSPRGHSYTGEYAPETESAGFDARPIADLRLRSASLVLGEPGAGKSTALSRLEESIRDEGWDVEFLDLKNCFSESSLERAFQRLLEIVMVTGKPRVLLLDSVDETPGLIRNYIRFLEQRLTQLIREEWRVIAVCRTAESVKALDALFEDLEPGAVHVLLPLRLSDVSAIAESAGIDSGEFIGQVSRRRLDSLAAVPFTLNLLCQVYSADSAFPEARSSIFERAISLIMADETISGYTPVPRAGIPPIRRKVAAERLAAFSALTEVGGFGIFTVGEVSNGLQTERLIGTESSDDANIDLTNDDFQNLLRTPLFADSGVNERHFAHRRLRDFLAAKFLVRQNLERAQLVSILTVADGRTIPPQMIDIATWLVVLKSSEFEWLLVSDPLSLVRNRIGEDLPNFSGRLVNELLQRADETDHALSWRDELVGLGHSGLVDQLRSVGSMTESQQAVSLRILRHSYVPGLESELLSLIDDSDSSIRIRELAVDALENHPEVLAALDIHAQGFFDNDRFNELRGDLLRALWPAYLSVDSLLSLLKKPSKSYFGSCCFRSLMGYEARG